MIRRLRESLLRFRKWTDRHRLALVFATLGFLFLLAYLWPSMAYFIHAGEAGVLWRRFLGGTQTSRVYREGFHLIPPWDVMAVYNVRIQRADEVVEALTRDGLRVELLISMRYRPVLEQLGFLHKRVGPHYLHTVLLPELSAAVREEVAKYRPDQLYTFQTAAVQNDLLRKAFAEVRDRYVVVDELVIREVRLPAAVQAAIQRKLVQEQQALEYVYRLRRESQEAERKRIEAQGIRSFQDIVTGGISDRYLRWKGIDATLELARSPNSKVVVIGAGDDGMPLILGGFEPATPAPGAAPTAPASPP
ncbi:MAG TPA: prohibitin family protein [Thermoanaerobaculia bacterium]|nr:prohibitin family protein [Thermoanaerobaculia bacterium]